VEGTVETILPNLKQFLSTKEEKGHRRETSGVIEEDILSPKLGRAECPILQLLKKGKRNSGKALPSFLLPSSVFKKSIPFCQGFSLGSFINPIVAVFTINKSLRMVV